MTFHHFPTSCWLKEIQPELHKSLNTRRGELSGTIFKAVCHNYPLVLPYEWTVKGPMPTTMRRINSLQLGGAQRQSFADILVRFCLGDWIAPRLDQLRKHPINLTIVSRVISYKDSIQLFPHSSKTFASLWHQREIWSVKIGNISWHDSAYIEVGSRGNFHSVPL